MSTPIKQKQANNSDSCASSPSNILLEHCRSNTEFGSNFDRGKNVCSLTQPPNVGKRHSDGSNPHPRNVNGISNVNQDTVFDLKKLQNAHVIRSNGTPSSRTMNVLVSELLILRVQNSLICLVGT
jgi:hypothetical protein